jgi:hypothetical protein
MLNFVQQAGIAIPNPDSLQEFKIQTTNYGAGFGRDAGAIACPSGGSGAPFYGGPAVACAGSNINRVALNLLRQKIANGTYLIPTPQRYTTVSGIRVDQSTFSIPSQ